MKLGDVNEGLLDNKNLYNDKELFDDADLNWYDYGFRNYDPQIGRFPQLDPLTDDYPFYTPYQYAGNEPIANVDLDGLEEYTALMPVVLQGVKNTAPAATTSIFKLSAKVIPTVSNIAAAHSEQSLIKNQIQSFPPVAKNGPTISQCCNYYVSDAQKADYARQTSDAGYNSNGTLKPWSLLAQSKTWNNFADKVVFSPAVDVAAMTTGLGEVAEGLRLMKFGKVAAKGGWKVGESITNLTAKGNVPAWSTVRQRFWKNEAFLNGSTYSQNNLLRMQKGLAPQRLNPNTILMESMELHHHTVPQRNGGLFDFMKVWPDEHRALDPFRR